ncbi:hypothetical protein GCM10023336_77240 [Streptomyces similanensis]|uniref:Uncharacterized protein n=1 Tax=Streptomyces similanensis TaxID=1274988 RepID=A0ABP9LQ84_9ACTN
MKPVGSPPGSRTACGGYDQMLSTVTLLLSRTNEPSAAGPPLVRAPAHRIDYPAWPVAFGGPERVSAAEPGARRSRSAEDRKIRSSTPVRSSQSHGISADPD